MGISKIDDYNCSAYYKPSYVIARAYHEGLLVIYSVIYIKVLVSFYIKKVSHNGKL